MLKNYKLTHSNPMQNKQEVPESEKFYECTICFRIEKKNVQYK